MIVTADRPGFLEDALLAVERQTWAKIECIVVDNGMGGGTGAVARRHGARYVPASRVTLGTARQMGVDAAQGEIVAFTDDDCVPGPEWLAAVVGRFRMEPSLLGVQGRTEAEPGPIGSHTVQIHAPDRLYQTCNIAYRRDALASVGGFDRRFSGWFEDTALGARISARGPIGFEPRACVLHRAVPRRPFDRDRWRALLLDEHRLSREYPAYYRAVRGPSFLSTVITRWLLGSPLKTLIRALRGAPANMTSYLALVRLLLWERYELLCALRAFPWKVR